MGLPMVHSAKELIALVNEVGFLPFFAGTVPGFSLEECTPEEQWFREGVEGPWEWKSDVIRGSGCAYGRFFKGRTGYVSRAWFPELANVRRGGKTFEERYDAGLIPHDTKRIYDTLTAGEAMVSRDLRWHSDCPKRTFDRQLARLYMQTDVVTVDFSHQVDRFGRPYGWGLAWVDTPERAYGEAFTEAMTAHTPEESRARIMAHLQGLWPNVPEKRLLRLIEG